MDKQQFLEESHKYLDNLYSEFCEYQRLTDEIFGVFHDLCVENGIEYCLCSGTLLGRVRDGGNIPWDYDYDVCMPVNFAQKFIDVLKNKLPEGYTFDSNFVGNKSPFFQTRIGKKGYDINVLHVDIFYLVGGPKEKTEKFQKKIKNLFLARWGKKLIDNEEKSFIKRIAKKLLLKLKYKSTCFFNFDGQFKKLAYKYDYYKSEKVLLFTYNAEIFDNRAFEPIKCENIGGRDYLMPSSPDAVLNGIYKNYKEYLPVSDRFEEFYSSVKMMKK